MHLRRNFAEIHKRRFRKESFQGGGEQPCCGEKEKDGGEEKYHSQLVENACLFYQVWLGQCYHYAYAREKISNMADSFRRVDLFRSRWRRGIAVFSLLAFPFFRIREGCFSPDADSVSPLDSASVYGVLAFLASSLLAASI